MCKVCQKTICLPNCPAFSRNQRQSGEFLCTSCGELLRNGDGYYQKDGFPYCESCLDFADLETLIRICELDKREWLEGMGFVHKTVESRRI